MISIIERKNESAEDILRRDEIKNNVSETVSGIIDEVRRGGDAALIGYEEKFDKVRLTSLEVTKEEIDEALRQVDEEYIAVIRRAKANIEAFHKNQITEGFRIEREDGVVLGQKVMPIERVGLYVPGGTAAYPSTVLMNCIPARLAGVSEICMVTPPSKDGKVNPVILAAAAIAGVDRIFKVGGAQAIAALSYGTESVPRVDKIVGPGNMFVAEAKRQVFGRVAIDMIAGPSEILVVSDGKSDARTVAADLLSQAEHDRVASAILITTSADEAKRVSDELEVQIPLLPRAEIARTSIDDKGKIIVVGSVGEAVELANEIAPEHLEMCVEQPMEWLGKIKHAGSIFLGRNCPEALGDYFAGPNHTLPTGGTARFSSPLSVYDFVKKSAFTYYTKDALCAVKDDIAYFAEHEGLHAHARSVLVRFDSEEK